MMKWRLKYYIMDNFQQFPLKDEMSVSYIAASLAETQHVSSFIYTLENALKAVTMLSPGPSWEKSQ